MFTVRNRLFYDKESSDLTKSHKKFKFIQNDMNASVFCKHKISNKAAVTCFSMYITIVDGKV